MERVDPRSALGLIDSVMPWCSESAQKDLRKARAAVAELLTAIENLGLLYEAGCDIDDALARLEALAARITKETGHE